MAAQRFAMRANRLFWIEQAIPFAPIFLQNANQQTRRESLLPPCFA
jgi:hypothetical protein